MSNQNYSIRQDSFERFIQPYVNQAVKFVAREACYAVLDAIDRHESKQVACEKYNQLPFMPGYRNGPTDSNKNN